MRVKDDLLQGFPNIAHGFYGRKGGVSEGLYDSLNVGFGTKDDPANIAENRARVARDLGAAPENLITLYQIHSPDCVYVSGPFSEGQTPEADAMVTDIEGLAIGVLTADCVPVLFYGEKEDGAPVVGAAHAGWGGAYKGILESTVRMMRDYGAINIAAAIGPCIRQKSYEVDDRFMARFIEQDNANEHFFIESHRPDHFMFDLPAYVRARLNALDIHNISDVSLDTYTLQDDYFSYRRATHMEEADYGRQISSIIIRSSN